ncbi:hypothetical protein LUZ62_050100 [Rhynchospora pubera]|uniref:Uncharacterized protein n=1 Tax=Rhynchospora pubera TaxID=906938 RepID=A0AAV8G148_9POAL|nr:hypothetical protein LUZ62_082585 [Rhynchospora pubera]KAJ4798854.1 hypothetical protein LUZ62_050100 [Rhynchospora pubera]
MAESPLSLPTTSQQSQIWENYDDYQSDNEESEPESDSESESDSDSRASASASPSPSTKPGTHQVWPRKGSAVMLEGYVDGSDSSDGTSDGSMARTKSLTDDDLEELKGCLDLGFGFSYEEIPELCNTLPALELCYSMSQRFLDEKRFDGESDSVAGVAEASVCSSPSRSPVANWRISEPGDDPEEVKARLKYWAQAVACTVKLCN